MLSSFTHTGMPLYPYTPDLLALTSHINPAPPPLPPHLALITSPFNYDAWQLWLDYHPDQYYTSYILHGFRIGFNHTNIALRSASTNHSSAIEHPEIIKKSLVGPLNPTLYPYVHTSSLGAIPKKKKKHLEKKKMAPDIRPIAPQIPQH